MAAPDPTPNLTHASATTAALEQNVDRELRSYLAKQLGAEGGTSELAHVVLAGMVTLLIWRWAPHPYALLWFNAVAVAAFGRSVYRRTANVPGADAATIILAVRRGVIAVSLAWAAGMLLIGPSLPIEALAWITVVFAGLIAGGTASLLGDPASFYILLLSLLASLMVAVGLNGSTPSHVTGMFLVVTYGAAMTIFFRRSHAMLLGQFRIAKRLELTERAAGEAREAAQRLSRVIEATPDHVVTAAADGTLRYMNRAGREMIGIGPDEDLAGTTMLGLFPPRIREQIETENLPRAVRDGHWEGETLLLRRDGTEIPVSLVALIERSQDGTVQSMSAIARDVTDEVAAREALKAARDAAEQATAAKSSFLANTSHEIRTPLNGILGMVELLLDTELTPSQRRSVELIASSGETLLNTINDVLDLSKIEAEQLELEEVPFDLHQVLHSCVRLFAPKASSAGIELVSDVRQGVPQHVVGDPHRLRQILSNLIGNAVKFTSAGEVVLTASAEGTGQQSTDVRFSVSDTGIGIAAEHIQQIFEPFRQVDASTTRHYGGTGLGLSISRRLVEIMGGKLEITSAVGTGSDFHFTIPVRISNRIPSGAHSTQLIAEGLRVLVVDDHPVNRRVAVDMLHVAHCDVDDFADATSALDALLAAAARGQPYRLVVSDVQMPGRDGFDLAADVQSRPELKETVVMLLSSSTRRGDNERCRALGVAAYLQKPVSRVELLEAMASALHDPGAAMRPSVITRVILEDARRMLRILIAEDNRVNQEVASAMLRKRGHEVVIVDDGRAAVEAVGSQAPFDVILMDVQMPRLDGVEATREIRASHPVDPMIVALTANVSTAERDRCLAAGMNGYLTKPFRPHELFAAVENWGTNADTPASEPQRSREEAIPVDLAGFRATLAEAGIESVGDQMLRLFLDDGLARMAALGAAMQGGDARSIAQAAHAFKSGAGNVRAGRLTELLQSVEAFGAEGKVAGARSQMSRIETEFQRVVAYLSAELASAGLS